MFSLCLYFLQNLKYNTVDAFSPRAPEPGCLLHSLVGKKLYYMTDFLVFIKKKTVYNLSALLAKKRTAKLIKLQKHAILKYIGTIASLEVLFNSTSKLSNVFSHYYFSDRVIIQNNNVRKQKQNSLNGQSARNTLLLST